MFSVNERGRLDPTTNVSLILRRKITCNTLHFKCMYITNFINFKRVIAKIDHCGLRLELFGFKYFKNAVKIKRVAF